jgi:hypothetical protein
LWSCTNVSLFYYEKSTAIYRSAWDPKDGIIQYTVYRDDRGRKPMDEHEEQNREKSHIHVTERKETSDVIRREKIPYRRTSE